MSREQSVFDSMLLRPERTHTLYMTMHSCNDRYTRSGVTEDVRFLCGAGALGNKRQCLNPKP